MKRIFLLAVLMAALASCQSPKAAGGDEHNAPEVWEPYEASGDFYSSSYPPGGIYQSQNTGGVLLKYEAKKRVDGIVIPHDICDGAVKKGAYPAAFKSSSGNNIRFSGDGFSTKLEDGCFLEYDCRNNKLRYVRTKDGVPRTVCEITEFEHKNIFIVFFYREIVYLGKKENELRFRYREFRREDELDVSTEFSYDLGLMDRWWIENHDIVSCGRARIKIFSATDTSVSYMMLQDFHGWGGGK